MSTPLDPVTREPDGTGPTPTQIQLLLAQEDTARTINQLTLAILALTITGFVMSGYSDAGLLSPQSVELNVPILGATSARQLLYFLPVALIALRIYLSLYLRHWRRLEAQSEDIAVFRKPILSAQRHPVLRVLTQTVYYPLFFLILIALTWKLLAFPTVGMVMLLVLPIVGVMLLIRAFAHRAVIDGVLLGLVMAGAVWQTATGLADLYGREGPVAPTELPPGAGRPEIESEADEAAGGVAVWIDAALTGRLYHRPLFLRGARLSDAYLFGEDLHNARLQEAQLDNAELATANLSGARLRKTDLSSADLRGTDLRGAFLEEATLAGADLGCYRDDDEPEIDPICAQLADAKLATAVLTGVNLQGVDAAAADFWRADLTNAQMTDGRFEWARFGRANLTDVDFSRANMAFAYLSDATISGTDFSQTDLSGAIMAGLDLTSATFTETTLVEAELSNTVLRDADLRYNDMARARLDSADLSGAYLDGAILDGADLRRASLTQASLDEVRLDGADLTGVRGLTQDQLDRACGTGTTLPKGFIIAPCPDPDAS